MLALLVYGSLMHPLELAEHLVREHPLVPVRVRGFRRSFCQEPSWRVGEAGQRAVLTVQASKHDWINGILISDLDPGTLRDMDRRERGYVRVTTPASALRPYPAAGLIDGVRQVHLYTGRADMQNDNLLPNPEYLDLCMEAAQHWGSEFLGDFLSTTFLGETCLRDYSPAGRRDP